MKKQYVFVFACLLALCLGLVACSSSSSSAASSGSASGSASASASAAASSASAASTSSSAASSSSSASAASSSAAASSASASAASSSAAASSASASAASAGAATGEVSYNVTDHFFREVYEKDGTVYFDTAMEVINTGDTTIMFDQVILGATKGNGEIVAEPRANYLSPNYLAPGGSAFVYPAGAIKLPEGSSVNDTFKTGSSISFKTTDKTVTEYATNVDTYFDDDGRPSIGGTVTNDTKAASGEVTVVVSFYDNDDNLLGVAEDAISNIAPGESMRFRVLSDDLQHHCSWALIAKYKVTATSLN